MWREIRGKGLAYSYSMTLQPSEGSLILKLARAAQLTRAYEEALNILVSEKKNVYCNCDHIFYFLGSIQWHLF